MKRFIVFIFLVVLAGCDNSKKVQSIKGGLETPSQELWDAKINFSDGKLKKAILEAKYIAKYENQLLTRAKNIKLTFLDSIGNVNGVLNADSGTVMDDTQIIEVFGNILFYSTDGSTLWTEALKYNPEDGLVKTDKPVKLSRRGEYLQGEGMETDINMNKVKFIGNVKGKASGSI